VAPRPFPVGRRPELMRLRCAKLGKSAHALSLTVGATTDMSRTSRVLRSVVNSGRVKNEAQFKTHPSGGTPCDAGWFTPRRYLGEACFRDRACMRRRRRGPGGTLAGSDGAGAVQ